MLNCHVEGVKDGRPSERSRHFLLVDEGYGEEEPLGVVEGDSSRGVGRKRPTITTMLENTIDTIVSYRYRGSYNPYCSGI